MSGLSDGMPSRLDVEVQLGLVRPHLRIVYGLEALANQIRAEAPKIEAGKRPTGAEEVT